MIGPSVYMIGPAVYIAATRSHALSVGLHVSFACLHEPLPCFHPYLLCTRLITCLEIHRTHEVTVACCTCFFAHAALRARV